MSDIFLSYSSTDRSRLGPFVLALEREGWSVWWDRTIPIGKTWDEVIDVEIARTRCVIVIWSQQSIGSEWVRIEADEAKQRGVLLPVLIDEVKIPLAFRRLQTASLIGWSGEAENLEFRQLCKGVSEKLQNTGGADSRANKAESIAESHLQTVTESAERVDKSSPGNVKSERGTPIDEEILATKQLEAGALVSNAELAAADTAPLTRAVDQVSSDYKEQHIFANQPEAKQEKVELKRVASRGWIWLYLVVGAILIVVSCLYLSRRLIHRPVDLTAAPSQETFGIERELAANKSKPAQQAKIEADRIRTQVLKKNGWSDDLIRNAPSASIEQSLAANDALLSLPQSATSVSIFYYLKNTDQGGTTDALFGYWGSLGYKTKSLRGFNDEASNVIWFRDPIPELDLKRIALSMIRAGILLKAIKPLRNKGASGVFVGYDIEFSTYPAWTVDEVKSTEDFASPREGINQAYVAVDSPTSAEAKLADNFLTASNVTYNVTLIPSGGIKTISTSLMTTDQAKAMASLLQEKGIRSEVRYP